MMRRTSCGCLRSSGGDWQLNNIKMSLKKYLRKKDGLFKAPKYQKWKNSEMNTIM